VRRRLVLTLVGLAAVVGIVVGISSSWDRLAEATQTKADVRPIGSSSEVVLEVEHNRYRPGTALAADALVGACSATVTGTFHTVPMADVGPAWFRITVEPQLGPHDEERFIGCLRDQTIDRVEADVHEVHHNLAT
jgi:hypothetical protein